MASTGEFKRDVNYIDTRITADGRDGYPVEPGRYRLVVARACPWANRAIIVHEDVKTLGVGSELAARLAEDRFDRLDAPVMRVTYPDTHVPVSHVLEQANLPNADKITDALRRLAAY